MADAQHITEFQSVTGADEQTARFFLASCNGDLNAAINQFFAGSGAMQAEPHRIPAPVQPASPSAHSLAPTPTTHETKKPKQPAGGPRLATLSDTKREEEKGDTNRYFTGGEKSGLQVEAPSGKGKPGDIVSEVFEKAKQHGAKPNEEEPPTRPQKSKVEAFTGTGFRLGSALNEPSRPIVAQPPPSAQRPGPRQITKTLTFYRNGFTVDDGPLRRFDDPANQQFLSDINEGVIPRELEAETAGGQLSVNLVDKKHEDFVPPKPVLKPFTGTGHTLGSGSPSPPPPAAATVTTATASAGAALSLRVDESQPTTTLQIRLHDGTRIVQKFNLTHTIGDVRQFIISSRGLPPTTLFDLMSTYPVRAFNDLSMTLQAAGLQNATLVTKLK